MQFRRIAFCSPNIRRHLLCFSAVAALAFNVSHLPAQVATPDAVEPDAVEASPATPAEATSEGEEAAPQPTLTIGDLAPPLKIAEWVHGEAVDEFKKDHLYVVEFWATWCGPCLASMPHVSKLQEEYRDRATFVGISTEEVDTVKTFLTNVQDEETQKTWADILTYKLGMDDGTASSEAYMRAAQENGIPCAFLVGRDGHIEWIGHPMDLDDVLAKVDAKQWDRAAFQVTYQEEKAMQAFLQQVGIALRKANQSGEWGPAIEALDSAIAKYPDHLGLQMAKMTALMGAERHDDLKAHIKQLCDNNWDNAQLLNSLAWEMVTRIDKEHRDLDAARDIANRANELTKNVDPSILDTLARVMFERGEFKSAVELQRKAVELAPQMKQLQAALKQFEAAVKEAEKPADEGAKAADEKATP